MSKPDLTYAERQTESLVWSECIDQRNTIQRDFLAL